MKPDSKASTFLKLSAFFVIVLIPILLDHVVGKIPAVNYEWLSDLLPKIAKVYTRMSSLFSIKDAEAFREFFVTNMVFYTCATLGLLVIFFIRVSVLKRASSSLLVEEPGIYGRTGGYIYGIVLLTVSALIVLVLPTPITEANKYGFFTIQPDIKSQIIVSSFFFCVSFASAFLMADLFNFAFTTRRR